MSGGMVGDYRANSAIIPSEAKRNSQDQNSTLAILAAHL